MQERGLVDARPVIEEFVQVGRQLIATGAEVLIPGCGLLAPCLRFAPGCETDYPQGLTHVDGVPIVDIYGATIRAAETLVEFKRAGSPWISRACQFAKASDEALEGAPIGSRVHRSRILGLLIASMWSQEERMEKTSRGLEGQTTIRLPEPPTAWVESVEYAR